jgi:hypothetical protein
MASVGGNLARDDWDDFGIGVPGSQMINGTWRFAVPVAPRTERSLRSVLGENSGKALSAIRFTGL